jgi:hypothetical protein
MACPSLGVQLSVALGVLAVVAGSMSFVVGATPNAMRLKRLLAVLEDDSNINRWDRSSICSQTSHSRS